MTDAPDPDPSSARPLRAVELTARGFAGRRVDLVGDFPDFRVRHRMREGDDGVHRVTLELPAGVYRWKLVVDEREWVLPEERDGIDRVDGYENAVRVVDGVAWPVRFAPDPRHLRREDDALLVQAEIEAGTDPPDLVLTVDDGVRTAKLETVAVRGETALVAARAPLPRGAKGTLAFTGVDGRFPIPTRAAGPAVPKWAERATFLFVLVDRWHRGETSPPDPRAFPRDTPSRPTVFFGGDLDGITASLSYFTDLGVDALVLSPLHPSVTPHRYDATDLHGIDARLGGEAGFARLRAATAAAGLKLVVDLSVSHVNHQHPYFKDVLEKQEASSYLDYFRLKGFPVRRRDPSTYEHYWDCIDLPWLALEREPAQAYALAAAHAWVERGVDGLRLDAMIDVPLPFWRALGRSLRARAPELLLLGEVVGDHLAPFLDDDMASMVTDARARDAVLGFLGTHGHRDVPRFVDDLKVGAHRAGLFTDARRVVYVDTHDTARLDSRVADEDDARIALALLAFSAHPVLLTAGIECALAAQAGEPPLDGAWPERKAMPPLEVARAHPRFGYLQALLRTRRRLAEDDAGPLTYAHADARYLRLERRGRGRRYTLTLDLEERVVRILVDGEVAVASDGGR